MTKNRNVRNDIIKIVQGRGLASPADIAKDLGRAARTLTPTLSGMVARGQLERYERGIYRVPSTNGEPARTPTDLRREWSTGNASANDVRRRVSQDERIANALDALKPITNDSHALVQLITLMREVIG